jgi:hypothetical protein
VLRHRDVHLAPKEEKATMVNDVIPVFEESAYMVIGCQGLFVGWPSSGHICTHHCDIRAHCMAWAAVAVRHPSPGAQP